ncbi:MAG: respiratory nitrate reductase subunit gamma, partial [Alphaproteobacteria bacterium]|nr:respiratory nitrate reductase subunit gamma [Alphaproteobacteria bacterium]
MPSYANFVLFGVYPYIALAVLAVGSVIRYDREPYTWRSGSSQLLRRRQLVWGSVLFHVGVLAIFGGHLVGLLTPIWIFDALGFSHGAKQLLAVGLGGFASLLALVGGGLLLHRRLFDARIRRTSSATDILILVMLYAQLILGLVSIRVSLNHLD